MHDDDHGHSKAAWSGVGVMLLGVAVACWGVMWEPDLLLYVGLAIFFAGALLWYAMGRAARREDALAEPRRH